MEQLLLFREIPKYSSTVLLANCVSCMPRPTLLDLQTNWTYMQKGKMLSEKALQIAEKRREAKGKGEKERYTHLNAEFQKKARRDKKAFVSDQCKEIEESIEWGIL